MRKKSNGDEQTLEELNSVKMQLRIKLGQDSPIQTSCSVNKSYVIAV